MSDSDSDDNVEYEKEEFIIRDFTFQVTTVSFLPITKLMALQQSQSEISGQKLWCGSISVIEYLLDNPNIVLGKSVIELGAGTGVLGMLCRKIGAKIVYLTDHDERSLDHMKQDIQDNNIDAEIIRLDWFNPNMSFIDLSISSPDIENVRIVAGDVLYKSALVIPFLTLVKQLLVHKNSFLLLCHVPRAGVEHAHVVQACGDLGLDIITIATDEWRKGACLQHCPPEDYNRAQLYHNSILAGGMRKHSVALIWESALFDSR
eukprot:gene3870-7720_t